MWRITGGLLALTACNAIYGVSETQLHDAAIDADCTQVMPDEDADCVANDADNCPGIANAAQEDRDGDLVGDVCDPRPELAGDRLLVFQSFDDPVVAQQQWQDFEMTGEWKFEPGEVRRAGVDDSFSALQIVEPRPESAIAVEIGFRVDAVADATFDRHYEIMLDHPPFDLSGGHYCMLVRGPADPVGAVDALLQDQVNSAGNRLQLDDPQPGDVVVIQLARVADTELRCRVRVGEQPTDVGKRVKAPTGVWTRTGTFSLYVRRASIAVLWTALYTR